MHRLLSRTALTVLIIGIPVGSASAQSLSELQLQVQQLLAQVLQLQQQLGVPAAPQTAPPAASPTTPPSSGTCPNFIRIVRPGMSGTDVTALQQFLARDASIYPEGLVTGFYGALTQAAVGRWQSAQGIVSSGSPETNGFGQVGPRTAAAIVAACGGGSATTGSGAAPSGSVGGFIEISPVSGVAPHTVQVLASVNTVLSCSGATYGLDFGDGTQQQTIVVAPGNCAEVKQNFSHVYTQPGAYTVRLSSGAHQTTASVTVTAPLQTQGNLPAQKLEASPTSGPASLNVRFSGILTTANNAWRADVQTFNTLDFGDGATIQIPLPLQPNSATSFSVDHVYVSGGTFQAALYQGPKGSTVVGNPISISVSGLPAQRFEASPVSGSAPLTVTFSGLVNGANAGWCASNCTSTLSFGDGTSAPILLPTSQNGANTFSLQRTYSQAGTYTATLYQGSATAGHPPIGSFTITVTGSN